MHLRYSPGVAVAVAVVLTADSEAVGAIHGIYIRLDSIEMTFCVKSDEMVYDFLKKIEINHKSIQRNVFIKIKFQNKHR